MHIYSVCVSLHYLYVVGLSSINPKQLELFSKQFKAWVIFVFIQYAWIRMENSLSDSAMQIVPGSPDSTGLTR